MKRRIDKEGIPRCVIGKYLGVVDPDVEESRTSMY